MNFNKIAAPLALFCALGVSPAFAVCNISDAKLEEVVLKSPELRNPENRYLVRDLRTLRDAAFLLWSYGLHDDCEVSGQLRPFSSGNSRA